MESYTNQENPQPTRKLPKRHKPLGANTGAITLGQVIAPVHALLLRPDDFITLQHGVATSHFRFTLYVSEAWKNLIRDLSGGIDSLSFGYILHVEDIRIFMVIL